jgi:hypothetical protein
MIPKITIFIVKIWVGTKIAKIIKIDDQKVYFKIEELFSYV